jgi:hypothetical protein
MLPLVCIYLLSNWKTAFIELYLKECGLSNVAPNIKIVGGLPAVSHSWPAQAQLTLSKGNVNMLLDIYTKGGAYCLSVSQASI